MTQTSYRALFDLAGKTAVITGACGILGRRFAAGLAEFGAAVVLVDLDAGATAAQAGEIAERHKTRALGIAGSMVGKKVVPPSPGTFPTDGWLFAGLLVSVVLIVGALTFFPALTLGPLVEHFLARAGKVF